jgi:hypothetical protein
MAVTYAKIREWVLALPGTQEIFVERWGDHTLVREYDSAQG